MKAHPTRPGKTFKVQTPVFSPQKDTYIRLLIRKREQNETVLVPETADLSAIIRQEALFALFLGIIPSFLIPITQGFSDYVYEGWLNLVFGGICISLASAAIWRPRRPTWMLNESMDGYVPNKVAPLHSISSLRLDQ